MATVRRSFQELLKNERLRKERRNESDKLARSWIKQHPGIKEDPDNFVIENVPQGTTENSIRSIARFYKKKKLIRKLAREDSNDES